MKEIATNPKEELHLKSTSKGTRDVEHKTLHTRNTYMEFPLQIVPN